MKEFKSFTARRIVDLLKENREMSLLEQLKAKKKSHKTDSEYQVWQEGFHPQQILSQEMFAQKIEYIHQNPVRANLVDNPEDWKYSSASNYLNGKGILYIDPLT
jgi:REP element-mobilizing transposase RayT